MKSFENKPFVTINQGFDDDNFFRSRNIDQGIYSITKYGIKRSLKLNQESNQN